jgi:maleylacetoacetate isomerase
MLRLYGYWRSSAAYRVRIALELKGLAYEPVPTDLRAGAQHDPAYRARNPQGLVPTLEDGDLLLHQSLAIIEYLDETRPDPPLLPKDPVGRARVRALAQAVACDIHPLNNLRVLKHLKGELGQDEAGVQRWYAHWIALGLGALERMVGATAGRFAFGDSPTLADCCLVPQVYNARRYHCDVEPHSTLRRVEAACLALDAFQRARPERQPDATP